jgi:hypothetical protein
MRNLQIAFDGCSAWHRRKERQSLDYMLDWLAEDLIEVLDHFNFDFRIPDPKTDT